MSPVLRWGALAGLVVMLIDAVAMLMTRDLPPDSETAMTITTIDLAASVFMYALAGFRVGRATGIARAGAEAGVIAGGLAGLAVATFTILMMTPEANSTNPIGVIALNVALGGILGLFNGWLASRMPEPPR